jgi:ubiquitin C-terminal hydrolase
MSYRETEESLAIQAEDIEDAYMQTQEQIEEKIHKIKMIEEKYKEMDKQHLKEIAAQVCLFNSIVKALLSAVWACTLFSDNNINNNINVKEINAVGKMMRLGLVSVFKSQIERLEIPGI